MWGYSKSVRRLPAQPRQASRRRLWLQFVMVLLLSLLVTGSVFGWRVAAAATDITPQQAEAGELLLVTEHGFERALALDSEVDFDVSGLIARVGLKQTFRNAGDDWREAIYAFPLPEQAAVREMRVRVGERVIEGEIRERAAAKQIYQQAKAAGKKAGLVEQERPNLFTTSVANIGPGETVTVELEYVETLTYDNGEFSLRFPMTITPRYIPGEPLGADNAVADMHMQGHGWALNTDQVPDAARITPYQNPQPADDGRIINPITISALINAGLPLAVIESPWHDIRTRREDQRYHIELADGPVSMNRDFELRWRPQPAHEPQAALFTESVAGQRYALAMLIPPTSGNAGQIMAREMIYVIDTSGSMGGVSIRQARASLLLALDQLRPGDRFNVIEFNDKPQALFDSSRPVSDRNISKARDHVAGLEAGGGTEMRSALELALTGEARRESLRQIVFITDGAVGNEDALFELIHARLGASRLFTVGIGSAPNSYFMRKAAEFGRGTFTYIGAVNEVGRQMGELFRKLDSPVAGDLAINWPGDAETYPATIPDLYQGEALLVAARLEQSGSQVSISGRTADQDWQRSISIDNASDSLGVASVWARRKIDSLLDEKLTGRDETAVRADVLPVALAHRLMSPYTSFVAVEKTISRPDTTELERESVLNARPDGQSAQPYAWPATATDSRHNLLIGSVLLLLTLLLWWLPNMRERRSHA